jgi:molecular chaperone GrpE
MTSNDMQHDDPRRSEAADGAAPQNGAQPGSHAGAQSGAQSGAHAEAPQPEANPQGEALAALTAERDEFKDRALRTLAEMENLRRRTEREVADARTYAVTNFARDVLNVADNIRRALESVPAEARSSAEGALKGLIEGIELTERDLAKTLERHGVKAVEPQGQRFDPNRHQAMFEVPNTEVPNGTVVPVVQSGYVIGERVLRPALVGVSKGGPKAAGPDAA